MRFRDEGRFIADIYRDAADATVHPKHTAIERREVNRFSTIALHLAAGGGAAIRIRPRERTERHLHD